MEIQQKEVIEAARADEATISEGITNDWDQLPMEVRRDQIKQRRRADEATSAANRPHSLKAMQETSPPSTP